MDNMANSAGAADAEMSVITNSITYHLNALGQTWVSVAQNLIQSTSFKNVVDGLTTVANGIDWLTEKLGLLGTAGAGVALGGIIHLIRTVGRPKETGFKSNDCAYIYSGGDAERDHSVIVLWSREYWQNRRNWPLAASLDYSRTGTLTGIRNEAHYMRTLREHNVGAAG